MSFRSSDDDTPTLERYTSNTNENQSRKYKNSVSNAENSYHCDGIRSRSHILSPTNVNKRSHIYKLGKYMSNNKETKFSNQEYCLRKKKIHTVDIFEDKKYCQKSYDQMILSIPRDLYKKPNNMLETQYSNYLGLSTHLKNTNKLYTKKTDKDKESIENKKMETSFLSFNKTSDYFSKIDFEWLNRGRSNSERLKKILRHNENHKKDYIDQTNEKLN